MTGRSPFVERKGPERQQNYGFNLSGTLVPGRTSFSMNVNGLTAFDTPILRAALVGETRSETLSIRRPRNNGSITSHNSSRTYQTDCDTCPPITGYVTATEVRRPQRQTFTPRF